jgi:hypothetical protein
MFSIRFDAFFASHCFCYVMFCTSNSGLQSSAQSSTFSYSAPTIQSINPGQAATSGMIPITIGGSNFGQSTSGALAPSVLIGSQACPLVSVSSAQIVCTVASGEGLSLAVSVSVGGQQVSVLILIPIRTDFCPYILQVYADRSYSL